MSYGNSSSKDGIPAKGYKALSKEALQALHSVLTSIWEEAELPADLLKATIVVLYKNKSFRADCRNSRGICLLSIAGKILALIIFNRPISTGPQKEPESQCGFRPNYSSVDTILAVRQV